MEEICQKKVTSKALIDPNCENSDKEKTKHIVYNQIKSSNYLEKKDKILKWEILYSV